MQAVDWTHPLNVAGAAVLSRVAATYFTPSGVFTPAAGVRRELADPIVYVQAAAATAVYLLLVHLFGVRASDWDGQLAASVAVFFARFIAAFVTAFAQTLTTNTSWRIAAERGVQAATKEATRPKAYAQAAISFAWAATTARLVPQGREWTAPIAALALTGGFVGTGRPIALGFGGLGRAPLAPAASGGVKSAMALPPPAGGSGGAGDPGDLGYAGRASGVVGPKKSIWARWGKLAKGALRDLRPEPEPEPVGGLGHELYQSRPTTGAPVSGGSPRRGNVSVLGKRKSKDDSLVPAFSDPSFRRLRVLRPMVFSSKNTAGPSQ